jgi:rRNA-processing protein FCF1
MNYAYIDTNAFLTLANGSRLLEAIHKQLPYYTAIVLDGVQTELQKIGQGSSKDARAAKLALDIIQKQHLKTQEHSQPYVDTALVEIATSNDAIITLDKELQKRARKASIPVFTISRRRIVQVA